MCQSPTDILERHQRVECLQLRQKPCPDFDQSDKLHSLCAKNHAK